MYFIDRWILPTGTGRFLFLLSAMVAGIACNHSTALNPNAQDISLREADLFMEPPDLTTPDLVDSMITIPTFMFEADEISTTVTARHMGVADFNGDGFDDLVVNGSRLAVHLTVAGQPLPNYFISMPAPVSFGTADINADGHMDIVGLYQSPWSVGTLIGMGDGTFQPLRSQQIALEVFAIAVADIDGDGKPDALAINMALGAPGYTASLLGNGGGSWSLAGNFRSGNIPVAVATGDFRGNRQIDAVVVDNDDLFAILRGNGDGTFAPAVQYGLKGQPNGIVVRDFNGDGHPDFAVSLAVGGAVAVILNHGDGTFEPPVAYPAETPVGNLVSADFNRDGRVDLAVANFGSAGDGRITVLLGHGDGTFSGAVTVPVPGFYFLCFATLDLDGDHKWDFVVAEPNKAILRILRNTTP